MIPKWLTITELTAYSIIAEGRSRVVTHSIKSHRCPPALYVWHGLGLSFFPGRSSTAGFPCPVCVCQQQAVGVAILQMLFAASLWKTTSLGFIRDVDREGRAPK